MGIEEATREAFDEITPDDINIPDINGYDEETKADIISNIAEWVCDIETGKTWDEATEGEQIGYLERAEEMVESGMIVDADGMSVDVPAVSYEEEAMKETFDPSASDLRREENYTVEGEVSEEDFYNEYSNEDVLEELGYKEVGDGLYISSDDYENCIDSDKRDSVCAD